MREESGTRQRGEIEIASLEREEIKVGNTEDWDDMGARFFKFCCNVELLKGVFLKKNCSVLFFEINKNLWPRGILKTEGIDTERNINNFMKFILWWFISCHKLMIQSDMVFFSVIGVTSDVIVRASITVGRQPE